MPSMMLSKNNSFEKAFNLKGYVLQESGLRRNAFNLGNYQLKRQLWIASVYLGEPKNWYRVFIKKVGTVN